MAQDLDQQPGGIAAGTGAQRERLFAGLDAGLHADHVADFVAAGAGSGRSGNRWCGSVPWARVESQR